MSARADALLGGVYLLCHKSKSQDLVRKILKQMHFQARSSLAMYLGDEHGPSSSSWEGEDSQEDSEEEEESESEDERGEEEEAEEDEETEPEEEETRPEAVAANVGEKAPMPVRCPLALAPPLPTPAAGDTGEKAPTPVQCPLVPPVRTPAVHAAAEGRTAMKRRPAAAAEGGAVVKRRPAAAAGVVRKPELGTPIGTIKLTQKSVVKPTSRSGE